jgi:hypothetical protein
MDSSAVVHGADTGPQRPRRQSQRQRIRHFDSTRRRERLRWFGEMALDARSVPTFLRRVAPLVLRAGQDVALTLSQRVTAPVDSRRNLRTSERKRDGRGVVALEPANSMERAARRNAKGEGVRSQPHSHSYSHDGASMASRSKSRDQQPSSSSSAPVMTALALLFDDAISR